MDDVCITRWISGGYCKQIRSSAWLEHYTDNVGVSSSNLDGSTKTGGLAQLARASALHAEGHRFDSDILHHDRVGKIAWNFFGSSLNEIDEARRCRREVCWFATKTSYKSAVIDPWGLVVGCEVL